MEDVVIAGDWWAGRRVFLTGHTGFKGSWLVALLSRLGSEVHGFALPAPDRGLFRVGRIEELTRSSTEGNILSRPDLSAALAAAAPEVVIHMAAQPLVRLSYDEPLETYAVNVMGTAHVLEAVRTAPSVRACIVVTSDKCYENREWDWGYREGEAMGGHDPYSSSKGCAELVTAAYRRSFFEGEAAARIGSGRAGNVIGGGDWSADRLVPDLVRTFAAGGRTLIRNPAAIRPWQHVLDPLFGYLRLAERLASDDGAAVAQGWNFGPDADAERTVRQVVEAVAARWGDGAGWNVDDRVHPHEAGYLKLDSSRAKRFLHWRPVWAFEEAIAATVDWYKNERDGRDMRECTFEQIEAYLTHLGVGSSKESMQ